MDRRQKIVSGIDLRNSVGIEIGALDKPIVRRADGEIIYVDFSTTEDLIKKYHNDPSVNIENIVDVNAIWGKNTLLQAIGGKKVDYIVASHVIEHVPDLITWLAELSESLNSNGSIRLAIPDRRFTFDYLRHETQLKDVLAAYAVKARVPQPQQLLDHLLGTSVVDIVAAWEGKIDPACLKKHATVPQALNTTQDMITNGTYHDVHCWIFTPLSFAQLFLELAENGLVNLACDNFTETQEYTYEFFVSLKPSDDKKYIVDSWVRMIEAVNDHISGSSSQQLVVANKQIETLRGELKEEMRKRLLSEDMTKEVRSMLHNAENQIHALKGSTSWRVTSPLRVVGNLIRRQWR